MKTNKEMVNFLVRIGVLKTEAIIQAFLSLDRIDFVRFGQENEAYEDYPLPIGLGQTISQPYTVAFMLELLEPKAGDHILDIGSGSGWTTSLLAHIATDQGSVLGMEILPELVEFGQANLEKYHFPHARIVQAGNKLGQPGEQFDRILGSASARDLPKELIDQLKPGGRLVLPVQHSIIRVDKFPDGTVNEEEHYGFVFVPLRY